MQSSTIDHYGALGLERGCSAAQIRTAYRKLARAHHPDVNPESPDAMARTQALNAAYEVLGDPIRRRSYDRECGSMPGAPSMPRAGRSPSLSQVVYLQVREFISGTRLVVRVNDPGNPGGAESYELEVPPATSPGARIRIARSTNPSGGFLVVRLKARPDARFKPRGSDLRCDLRVSVQRAALGGTESMRGVTGNHVRVQIPARVACREVLRIAGEGLPKPHGGRGDLFVRVIYRPDVRISRA